MGLLKKFARGVGAAASSFAEKSIDALIEERKTRAILELREQMDIRAEGRADTRQVAAEGRAETRQIGAEDRAEGRQIAAEGRAEGAEGRAYQRNRADKVSDDKAAQAFQERMTRLAAGLASARDQNELSNKIAAYKKAGFTDAEIKQALLPRSDSTPYQPTAISEAPVLDAKGHPVLDANGAPVVRRQYGSFNQATGAVTPFVQPVQDDMIEVPDALAQRMSAGARPTARAQPRLAPSPRQPPGGITADEVFSGSLSQPSRAELVQQLYRARDPNEVARLRQLLDSSPR